MAQEIRYKLLNLELPHGLLGSTIDNLASLPATKHVDQRGRQAWVYYETVQIGRYTDVLLKMVGEHIACQWHRTNRNRILLSMILSEIEGWKFVPSRKGRELSVPGMARRIFMLQALVILSYSLR